VVLALTTAACGRLGTGLPACDTPTADPSPATVLTLQAVPEAEFSPCINSIQLGWDEVEFHAESNLAELEFGREFSSFLNVSLTPACDIGDAQEVPSGLDGITRYEDIHQVSNEIRVTIIPESERPRIFARTLIDDLQGVRVEGRSVVFHLDEDIDFSVRARVNRALFTDQFVWIISDLDVDEGTLEMRATSDGEGARGLEVDDALDRMEDMTSDVQYVGQWYFIFAGGCITYDFDADGSVATSIAADAEEAIGFYDNADLREAAQDAGFDVVGE
jgi:hypothetical protein